VLSANTVLVVLNNYKFSLVGWSEHFFNTAGHYQTVQEGAKFFLVLQLFGR